MGYSIRNERADDYRCVEELTRKAFWNVHAPGCDEHYLIHVMRSHADFIADLDLVLLVDDRIVGNIMYAKSKLVDEEGGEQEILTFGPVSILPEFQRKGYGKRLIEYSMERAAKKGYGYRHFRESGQLRGARFQELEEIQRGLR
jgi:predicted N-acetyltransferase YhbS